MNRVWNRVLNRVRGAKTRNQAEPSKASTLKDENNAKCRALFFELLFYLVFLILLIFTSCNNRDARAFRFKLSIMKGIDPKGQFAKITTPALMWNWVDSSLLTFLDTGIRIPFVPDETLVSNLAAYKLGPTRFRQHRARDGPCPVHVDVGNLTVRCSPFWSSVDRDQTNYGTQWTAYLHGGPVQEINNSHVPVASSEDEPRQNISGLWTYKAWSDIGGLPITGNLGLYPPGGYTYDLVDSQDDAKIKMRELRSQSWVDNRTRVVLIELTLYSPNINLFAMVTAMFEFPQAEVIMGNIHVHPFRLFIYLGNYSTFLITCDYLVYAATAWFVIREVSKIYSQRRRYFQKISNMLELVNALTSVASVVLHIGRHLVMNRVSRQASKATGQFYNFQTLSTWDELFGFLIAFVSFMSILQILHLLRFNKRMSMLGATIMRCSSDLWSFFLVFMLMLFAFMSFSSVIFGAFMKSYKTFVDTFESLLLIAIGQMEYKEMNEVSRVFTPAFVFLYAVLIVFILLNLLVTILMDAFADVREDVHNHPSDHELIEYIVSTATCILWNYSPFRFAWAIACKTGLISESEPASTRLVVTQLDEQICTSRTKTSESNPQKNAQSLLEQQFSLIHLNLDKVTERINRLLRNDLIVEMSAVIVKEINNLSEDVDDSSDERDACELEISKEDKQKHKEKRSSVIFTKIDEHVDDKKGNRFDDSKCKAKRHLYATHRGLGFDKSQYDLSVGEDFDSSLSEDLHYLPYRTDQLVPELGRVLARKNSVLSSTNNIVPDMRSEADIRRKNTLQVQVDVIDEFHMDDSGDSCTLFGVAQQLRFDDGSDVEVEDIPLSEIKLFDGELDDHLSMKQSCV